MNQKETKAVERKMIKGVSRRVFIKTAGAGVAAAAFGINTIIPGRASAGRKQLKILQWGHPVDSFNEWFDNYAKEWGEKNDTEVTVDHESMLFYSNAIAEVQAQKGHDINFMLFPPPLFEKHVIDHREIYEECERKYGRAIPLAIKSTYNPKTKKFFGFCDSYAPDPVNYRKDLWDGVGMSPNTWEDVRIGGAKIKKKYGNPVGIGLSREPDSNVVLRAIMHSYGSSVQDEEASVIINSKQTLEAVKFVRALFREAMTPKVFYWNPASNNIFMLKGKVSLAANSISITRSAQKK